MSGFDSSSLQSATRRFSPPDSVATVASHGGRRSASAAISIWCSVSEPAVAMIASYFACSAESLSKSASGSAYAA